MRKYLPILGILSLLLIVVACREPATEVEPTPEPTKTEMAEVEESVEAETAVSTQQNNNGNEDQWHTFVAQLPEDLINQLKNAALQTNMLEMDQLISQTSQYQPDLAQEFRLLADEFEYGKILNILDSS